MASEQELPSRPAQDVPKEAKALKEKVPKPKGGKNAGLELPDTPEYVQHRLDIFDKIKAKYVEEVAGESH